MQQIKFWDLKAHLPHKSRVKNKTLKLLEFICEKKQTTLGGAIDIIAYEPETFEQLKKELAKEYPEIK